MGARNCSGCHPVSSRSPVKESAVDLNSAVNVVQSCGDGDSLEIKRARRHLDLAGHC